MRLGIPAATEGILALTATIHPVEARQQAPMVAGITLQEGRTALDARPVAVGAGAAG